MINYEEERDRKVVAIEKKLDALIDALGFDVETIVTNKEGQTVVENGSLYHNQCVTHTDYKLTKRKDAGLIEAMGMAVDIMYGEFSYVEPVILAAFREAGWIDDE